MGDMSRHLFPSEARHFTCPNPDTKLTTKKVEKEWLRNCPPNISLPTWTILVQINRPPAWSKMSLQERNERFNMKCQEQWMRLSPVTVRYIGTDKEHTKFENLRGRILRFLDKEYLVEWELKTVHLCEWY